MYIRLIALCACIATCLQLTASEKRLEKEISRAKYDNVAKMPLSKLKELATKYNQEPLLRALSATKSLKGKMKKLGITPSQFLETALYIETHQPFGDKTHYSKRKTHLPFTLQHDPEKKRTFIVLDGKKNYIGKGHFKTVYTSIQYDAKRPKIVARAEEPSAGTRETALTKAAHGLPGVIETLGFCSHKKNDADHSTIYSKLYHPGSLQNVLEHGPKLKIKEKMKIALDILQGLSALHSAGIVHKDLGARNYLVDIGRGKPGNRKIRACIMDFGQGTFIRKAKASKVQGNTYYTAPEGLYRRKLKHKDYCKTDVFAVGCVFYRLFYGKKAPWQDVSYVKDVKTPLKKRFHRLTYYVNKATQHRRAALAKKRHLSVKMRFEQLILRMLRTDPAKRGFADEHYRAMQGIYERASKG